LASDTASPFQPLKASILLVDDRPANVLALEAVLKPLGHQLVPAHSGEEALRHLLDGEFAVILMDVQMPGLDGYQTAALIKQRERCRQVPIIFISGINKDIEHVIKGFNYGAVDYIVKPVEPFVLRAKVAAFVDLFLKEQQLKGEQEKLRLLERAELARRSEERFRRLSESMSLCVWAADANGSIQYCNRVWVEYSGMNLVETAGLGFLHAIHSDERERVRSAWLKSVRGGTSFETEFRLRQRGGESYRWHLCRAVPERGDKDEITGWIATATDIDAQKSIEEERARLLAAEQHARELAEAANASKDQFLAVLSHELRNPLNAMLGWARMLRSGTLSPEKANRGLDAVLRNAEAQMKLVEDLLDVSRIVAGKLRLQLRPASFLPIVKATVEAVRPEAEAKGIHLEVTLDGAAASDEVLADADRLPQIAGNLLSNAVKFTPAGGRITVSVRRDAGEMELRVSDTGAGIAPNLVGDIFDRFRQGDSTTTRAHSGLGLGLTIARRLVELHEGTITAESAGKGKGATFVVRLPLRNALEKPAVAQPFDAASAAELEGYDLQGLQVLIVDDQPDARELMADLLELHGAKVSVADSAAAALKALDDVPPDVLVSDIGMPHEDGYDLIRKVRARGSERSGNVPAVAVTGFATSMDAEHALALGFQRYVAKPIDPAALLSLIARLAGRSGKGEDLSTLAAAPEGPDVTFSATRRAQGGPESPGPSRTPAAGPRG
jgi:PAS domain S-box-containing protein